MKGRNDSIAPLPPLSRRIFANRPNVAVSLTDQTPRTARKEKDRDWRKSRKPFASADKFLVGLLGAALMFVQVLLLISLLTQWLRVENEDMLAALAENGIYAVAA
mmetsp:Transcript_74547/g.207140  ORF Transcript_74547/g.207140 Transcript_74547/m.207140 type:complete len:105 (-) Transcript_74547:42-356(-)